MAFNMSSKDSKLDISTLVFSDGAGATVGSDATSVISGIVVSTSAVSLVLWDGCSLDALPQATVDMVSEIILKKVNKRFIEVFSYY
jgi:hypothetical protein